MIEDCRHHWIEASVDPDAGFSNLRCTECFATWRVKAIHESKEKQINVKCHDCKRPYGDEHGFPDLIIPDWAWKLISPDGKGNGLLCPSCICKRLYDKDIGNIPSRFTSGSLTFEVKNWIRP